MHPMIMFSKINKWYGEYQALTDITAEVQPGEVVVLCGPSGSGKSTLIRTVNRLEDIQGGQILFDGQDVHGTDAQINRLRSRVGFVFQSFNLFPPFIGAGKHHPGAEQDPQPQRRGGQTKGHGTA